MNLLKKTEIILLLFVVPNPHLNAIALQLRRNATHVRLSVMVREQHFRLDYPCGIYKLLYRHGVRLVARQKSDVNVLDVSHFRYVLGVTGDIDSQSVKGENEAVVSPLGVELQVSFRGVVGGDCLKGDVVCQLKDVVVGHHRAIAKHFSAALVCNKLRMVARQQFDGRCVKMVEMFVGDEDVICFRHGGVIDGLLPQFRHGVDINLLAVVFDAHGGMYQGMDMNRLAAFGGEAVDFIRFVLPAGRGQSQNGQ